MLVVIKDFLDPGASVLFRVKARTVLGPPTVDIMLLIIIVKITSYT